MEKRKTKKRIYIKIIIIAILLALLIWSLWTNTAVQLNGITVTSKKLPQNFDGYKIAHISDFHDAQIGENNSKLIELLNHASPDIIVITGDIIDCNRPDVEKSLNFAEQAVKVAPCYYVTGNHEGLIKDTEYEKLKSGLESLGVIILSDKEAIIEKDGEKISLIGIDDPIVNENGIGLTMDSDKISALSSCEFTVLLSHRPEFFERYVQADVELALCGHVHGGQFRLPFVGGLYGPNQGLLPEYDSGLYTKEDTNMIVSRGIGNSRFPLRFNNRPEIVLVELKTETLE